ncbi:NADH-quinone oxidoreductase subunit H 1 [Salinisphaera shabanensis T35B1]|jgi:NADH-quinone oxidoreductase subunit H|uniref:NADH-quinone oxidoreductase subunit H n=1 Tax=Salinisphaera shabanensis TaxID=180542 RepID=UPI00333F6C49|tara:strand:+ start:322 stop:1239 length:918 start_codon:yes stop_codon:yes gene_type:complete
MIDLATFLGVLVLLGFGAWWVATLDELVTGWMAGRPLGRVAVRPLQRAAALLIQQQNETERPDLLNWKLAPALYLALAGVGLAVVPFAPDAVLFDYEVGIVLWGAVEALTVVVVFLHGWSANSQLAMIGAYRYVAIGLPVMLLSMFVLIAAALPAESLSVPAVVESQRGVWNVLRQPLGLPLFLLLGLSLTLRGPFNYADASDLAGGTSVEVSGASRLVWEGARLAMLVAFAAMASSAFLGGYLGPWLPGPVWLVLKTAALLVLLVALSHAFARLSPSRMLTLLWIGLMPLAFVDLILAGLEALT